MIADNNLNKLPQPRAQAQVKLCRLYHKTKCLMNSSNSLKFVLSSLLVLSYGLKKMCIDRCCFEIGFYIDNKDKDVRFAIITL